MSLDHKADVEGYINGVINGTITTGRLQRLAVWRYVDDIEHASERGLYFDEEIAIAAIDFSLCCKLFEGEWAGLTLDLRPEQKFIVWCLMGWRRTVDGLRRFRHGQIETGRKWGKSAFVAYLSCLLLYADDPLELGAQGYVAATKQAQANIVWAAAASMIEQSEELQAEAVIRKSIHEIRLPEFQSVFRPLASDSKKVDGFNPHFIVKDEEHAYRYYMRDFVNTLDSGFGSRRQPLVVTITTYGDETSEIWKDSHDYAVKVLESVVTGEVVNDTWFAFIAAVDQDADIPCFRCRGESCPWCGGAGTLPIDDPYDEACWIKANPGLGITPKLDRMRELANVAKQRKDKEPEFFQKNLNIIVSSKERFIHPEKWTSGAGELSDRRGIEGHGGIDLGRVNDFAAIAVCWQFHETDDEGQSFTRYEIETKTWTVRERPEELRSTQINRFVGEGHLVEHHGENVEFSEIESEIREWNDKWSIYTWAFDATFAGHMAQSLEQSGLQMFKFTQGHRFYTIPIEEFRKLLGQSRMVGGVCIPLLKHDGNPCLAWQAGNLIIDRNVRGERMPDKSRSESKIDAMVAVLMAFSECLYSQREAVDGYYLKNRLALGSVQQETNGNE